MRQSSTLGHVSARKPAERQTCWRRRDTAAMVVGGSREGGSGGGTGTEAGMAMGGVGVVEYQSIDIIEQRPAARPSRLAGCWLLAAGRCPAASYTDEPLERNSGYSRDYAALALGLSVQTSGRVFHASGWRAASRAATRHPAPVQLCSCLRSRCCRAPAARTHD